MNGWLKGILPQVLGWGLAGFLAYQAAISALVTRVSVLESTIQQFEQRLTRIETKLDQLLAR